MTAWQAVDLDGRDEPSHDGDPAEVAVAAELLEVLMARPGWHADAACREHPELTWFPERGESLEPARAICGGCLVRDECETYAVSLPDNPHGVWAGLSRQERHRLRQDAQRPPA